jgi:hypothetical protein
LQNGAKFREAKQIWLESALDQLEKAHQSRCGDSSHNRSTLTFGEQPKGHRLARVWDLPRTEKSAESLEQTSRFLPSFADRDDSAPIQFLEKTILPNTLQMRLAKTISATSRPGSSGRQTIEQFERIVEEKVSFDSREDRPPSIVYGNVSSDVKKVFQQRLLDFFYL